MGTSACSALGWRDGVPSESSSTGFVGAGSGVTLMSSSSLEALAVELHSHTYGGFGLSGRNPSSGFPGRRRRRLRRDLLGGVV